ncbi:MAG: HNH endonuclease [Gallionella sp.]|nr:HNH endonuclease [Gallionella sp.]
MKTCIYCGLEKHDSDFSDEHIWPDALGGDYLSPLWRTDDVCVDCNSMSGVFVDGSFIKSWLGTAERSTGAREYLSPTNAGIGVLPLDYIGPLTEAPTCEGEIAEYWCGPCGANIIHIRPNDSDEHWESYAGGDPRAKKSKAGRAYIALTSDEPFWIMVSLASFKAHFKRAERFVVNMDVPPQWHNFFKNPDTDNSVQVGDMKVVNMVTSAGRKGEYIKSRAVIQVDVGTRFLAKLGLAIGYKILGQLFLGTDYAKNLRKGFREADSAKRRSIPIRGTGFLNEQRFSGVEKLLSWPGGWVLLVKVVNQLLFLSVVSPSGKTMTVLVCDQPELVMGLDASYQDGLAWVTVPSLGEAVGPVPLPSYLAHQTNVSPPISELAALAAKRINPAILPPCRAGDGS